MKKSFYLAFIAILAILTSCSSGDDTAYKDLKFGMTLEEVKAKGYCYDEKTISEEGMDTYQCKYSDFAGVSFEKAELSFRDNKLAKVRFINTTTDASKQQEISKKVHDYLTSTYGQPKSVGKYDGWKDEKSTFLMRYGSDFDENMKLTYFNELAICSNDYYKEK